ncbi:hypothetical protein CC86DRAFT_268987, partial [Ophiobolus disseminans]
NSRHHLPLNSMLFESTPNLRQPLPANATLVNIHDAANLDVTALPSPPAPAERKLSVWARLLAKMKSALSGKKNKGPEIGDPMDFQHCVTGGSGPLREPVSAGGMRGSEEWEDVEEAR